MSSGSILFVYINHSPESKIEPGKWLREVQRMECENSEKGAVTSDFSENQIMP